MCSKIVGILLLTIMLTGCSTVQGNFLPLGKKYPSRATNSKVKILKSGMLSSSYTKVARIDVHILKTFYCQPSFDDALPEIKRQANLSGSDAVIDIQERTSGYGEYKEYHVTATGIRFSQQNLLQDLGNWQKCRVLWYLRYMLSSCNNKIVNKAGSPYPLGRFASPSGLVT